MILEFKKDAENDIKNDDVKTFGFGLLLPPKNEVEEIEKLKNSNNLKDYIKNLKKNILEGLIYYTNFHYYNLGE